MFSILFRVNHNLVNHSCFMLSISESYCLNEIGRRSHNEDAVWPLKNTATKEDRLFMVCDGVGGNSHGEIASALTCEGFASYFQQHLARGHNPDCGFIEAARAYVMQAFKQYISSRPGAASMSTTLALVYITDKRVLVAWCGDSRIYQIRDGDVIFQSEDHSLVAELVKRGELTKEEAASHPRKNIILRAIQYKEKLSEIDCVELTNVQNGDFILLCSDGFLENIGEAALHKLLAKSTGNRVVDEFQALCKNKTNDNYSMYLLRLSGAPVSEPIQPLISAKYQPRKGNTIIYMLLSMSLVAAVVFISWWFLNGPANKNENQPNESKSGSNSPAEKIPDSRKTADKVIPARPASPAWGFPVNELPKKESSDDRSTHSATGKNTSNNPKLSDAELAEKGPPDSPVKAKSLEPDSQPDGSIPTEIKVDKIQDGLKAKKVKETLPPESVKFDSVKLKALKTRSNK
jgi:PPM family protein phosphatase